MKKRKRFKGITACMLVLLLAVPFTVLSGQIQVSAAEDSARTFKAEELEQMLAPIALYPDALLAQVLTAATYPLEVVEANRFVKNNPGLEGGALLAQARDKDWEPSVKAMLGFPDLLAMMDEQLEWTRNLGDAFIVQQGDCMDAVQRLRQRAHARGNLTSTAEQVIVVEPQTKIIIIQPKSPKIVYVPVYDPTIIYGAWWYPAYPPYYFYPRRYVGITFFPRIFVGLFWGTWGCNWHNHHVYVNINYYKTFTKTYYHRGDHDRFYKVGPSVQPWRYDTRHRQVSRYRSSVTVTPSAPNPREYKQVAVRAPTVVTKETSRPVIISSTQRTKAQTDFKKAPAKASRENVAKQIDLKPQASVDSRSDAGKPSALTSKVKAGKKDQEIVRPPASVTKETSRPAINSSTQSVKVQTNVKKAPAPASKAVPTYRVSTKSSEKVELRSNKEEEEKIFTAPTSNSRGQKVEKAFPGKGKAEALTLESIGKKAREQIRPNRQDPVSIRTPEAFLNVVGR